MNPKGGKTKQNKKGHSKESNKHCAFQKAVWVNAAPERPRDPGDSKLVCKPLHLVCDLYTAVQVDLRSNREI